VEGSRRGNAARDSGTSRSPLSDLSQPDYDNLTAEEFFGAWSAISATWSGPRIDLSGEVRGNQLVLDEPAPVPVHGNEIHLGEWTIAIHLRPSVAAAPAAAAPVP